MGKLNKKQKIFWIVWLGGIVIVAILLSFLATGCNRKAQPQIIYSEKIVSKIDTLKFTSYKYDTIPCDDFQYLFVNKTDTIFVEVVKNVLKLNTIRKTDTIYRIGTIIEPQVKKTTYKIDNSVRNKAKDNSAIGNNNDLKKTTKKNNWWWIFLAGFLSAQLVNIGIKILIKKSGILNIWNMTN